MHPRAPTADPFPSFRPLDDRDGNGSRNRLHVRGGAVRCTLLSLTPAPLSIGIDHLAVWRQERRFCRTMDCGLGFASI